MYQLMMNDQSKLDSLIGRFLCFWGPLQVEACDKLLLAYLADIA